MKKNLKTRIHKIVSILTVCAMLSIPSAFAAAGTGQSPADSAQPQEGIYYLRSKNASAGVYAGVKSSQTSKKTIESQTKTGDLSQQWILRYSQTLGCYQITNGAADPEYKMARGTRDASSHAELSMNNTGIQDVSFTPNSDGSYLITSEDSTGKYCLLSTSKQAGSTMIWTGSVNIASNTSWYLEPADFQLGDANMDGSFDIRDVTLTRQYISGDNALNSSQLYLADFNGDGSVNISDITDMQLLLADSPSVRINGRLFFPGDRVEYTAYLKADDPFTSLQGRLLYDSSVLTLDKDEELTYCPLIGGTVGTYTAGNIPFFTSGTRKFKMPEYGVMLKAVFTVNSGIGVSEKPLHVNMEVLSDILLNKDVHGYYWETVGLSAA